MPFNKISGQSFNPPMLPFGLGAGEYTLLPAGQAVVGAFGSVFSPQLATNNPVTGQYVVQMGQYTALQQYDQGMNYWQDVQVNPWAQVTVSSDGVNYRLLNSTGCPVGAVITNAGASYTNGFYGYTQFGQGQGSAITIQGGITTPGNTTLTITPSAGGSLWNAIVGGAVSTTLSFAGTVFNGNLANANVTAGQSANGFGQASAAGGITASAGTNYTRPPILVFSPPVGQGAQPYILPTAICAITAGAISSVTVVDQGAGLVGLPGIVVVPQPGDTTGGGAVLGWLFGNTGTAGVGAGVGSGSILAMWPAYHGTPLTAVPTFTFSPASTTAVTAIMNFSITGITNTTPGVGYTNAYALFQGGITVGTPATNVSQRYAQAISNPIFPVLSVVAGTGVTTLAGAAGYAFSGVNIQAVPTIALGTQLAAGTVTTVAVQTPTVGGVNDVNKLLSF
jgi:hypothetical protein